MKKINDLIPNEIKPTASSLTTPRKKTTPSLSDPSHRPIERPLLEMLRIFEAKGKEVYGQEFFLSEDDYPLILRMLAWFLGDQQKASEWGIDLRKGILLSGPIGCGKTALMGLMRYFARPGRWLFIKATRDVALEFAKDGFDVIEKYSKRSFVKQTLEHKIYCFDDLGAENDMRHYGSKCNVMGEILLSRYDFFSRQGLLTHATTNLDADELEEIYGPRIRSRFREMFNHLSFPNRTKDKRK